MALAADAINGFGFGAGSNDSLIRVDDNYRSLFKRSATFAYDRQWNGQFNSSLGQTGTCGANALGNNLSIQTQGAGNTVYVLNSQQNSDSAVTATCVLGKL